MSTEAEAIRALAQRFFDPGGDPATKLRAFPPTCAFRRAAPRSRRFHLRLP